MPNHVYGIILIQSVSVGAQHAAPLRNMPPNVNVAVGSLGAIVRSFKSAVTKKINKSRGTQGLKVWQRNYFERIIRQDSELEKARKYIVENPLAWDLDIQNPNLEKGRF